MRSAFSIRIAALTFLMVCGSSALAGPLGVDPDGIPAFTGTTVFHATDGVEHLFADVDYAVFAPGDFSGADPSGGTDYVYAYQAYNTGGMDDVSLSAVTVGLAPGAVAADAGDDPAYPMVGGVSPNLAAVLADSVGFFFDDPRVFPGEFSTVVLFTSPDAPMMGVGSVIDGGLSDQQTLPTPVPEPGTLLLLIGLGAAGALRRANRVR